MHKLVFEFNSEEERDMFLGQFSDGGGEDSVSVAWELRDLGYPHFDYSGAFPAWGWDGKGDAIVKVTTEAD